MYKTAYAQEAMSSATTQRSQEYELFRQAIEMLEAAEAEGVGTMTAAKAIGTTRRLWTLLLEDLAREENMLSDELKANLISIGLWVLRECDDISLRKSNNFKALIDISRSIQDGLK